MCGIAGFTHSRLKVDPERIRSAVDTLRHRGPNQQGVFTSRVVSIGATRLKIIDLDGGDQPMVSANRDTAIAFNGEIYNHKELRAELEKLGHRFRSHADTETVLEAFREWGTDCFARLRGMFAVALWSEASGRLILARDRVGIKPLYIARRSGELYFGSELKAILIHPEIERQLSLEGLDCYLSMNYVPGPWTLVEGIEKLAPGHWLEWRSGEVRSECYWSLPHGGEHESKASAKELQCELDGLLSDSVKEHLASDVPLGVWLSGGIDSSTLVHYAAHASGTPLKTFSISFRGQSFDESDAIKQVAAHYGTDHQEFDVNDELDLASAIEEFAYYSDEPNADAGALPVWFLSRLTKHTATVALSGEGADELFGGYLTHRASILANTVGRFPGLKIASKIANCLPVSNEKISFEYKVKRFLEGCTMPAARGHVHWNGTFSDPEKRALIQSDLPRTLDSVLDGMGTRLADYLHFDQRYFLPDDILTKVDRISMAHALEVRPPFLDHRIVEFAATLPDDMKIRGSMQKVILRDLMRNQLPPSTVSRKKIGFDIPAHEWFRGPLRPLLYEAVEFAAAKHSAFFHMPAIDACVRKHMERRANLGYHLWGLTILFLWMKKWKIQTSSAAEMAPRTLDNVYTSI